MHTQRSLLCIASIAHLAPSAPICFENVRVCAPVRHISHVDAHARTAHVRVFTHPLSTRTHLANPYLGRDIHRHRCE